MFCILLILYKFYTSYTGLHKRIYLLFSLLADIAEEEFSTEMHIS